MMGARNKTAHPAETDLALYVSRDLPLWRRIRVGWHVSRCRWCRQMAEIYRGVRIRLRETASEMTAGVNWNQLAAEMAALAALLICAWVLNMPSSATQELGRAVAAIWSGSSLRGGAAAREGRV